jgi:hypothetical protein
LEQAKKIFDGLQHGTIDRSLFTDNANAYFSEQAVKDFASGLAPLGTPQSFVQASQDLRGGMTLRVYIIRFPQKILRAWTYEMPNGEAGAVSDCDAALKSSACLFRESRDHKAILARLRIRKAVYRALLPLVRSLGIRVQGLS